MSYTVKTLQLSDPTQPFYAVLDSAGNQVSWHTTQEEAQAWIQDHNQSPANT